LHQASVVEIKQHLGLARFHYEPKLTQHGWGHTTFPDTG
jgi:hypothetical protein